MRRVSEERDAPVTLGAQREPGFHPVADLSQHLGAFELIVGLVPGTGIDAQGLVGAAQSLEEVATGMMAGNRVIIAEEEEKRRVDGIGPGEETLTTGAQPEVHAGRDPLVHEVQVREGGKVRCIA